MPFKFTDSHFQDFQALADWSLGAHSDLPWRYNRTLYSTLVSEIMLQQTTVPTVLAKFEGFMKEFPSIESLASLNEDGLRKAWQGLGYYRRATNLLKAVHFIYHENGGDFPETREKLQEIPGIGPYTSSAIRAIGMDLPDLALDGNLKRVLTRYFDIDTLYGPKLEKELLALVDTSDFGKMLNKLGPRAVNEALMDLGREVCKASRAYCDRCILAKNCQARQNKTIEERPKKEKKEKQKLIPLNLYRFIIKNDKEEILLYQKNDKEWLSQQWEIPTFALNPPAKFTQYPPYEGELLLTAEKAIKTAITKYSINNTPILQTEKELSNSIQDFIKSRRTSYAKIDSLLSESHELHISTATHKVLKSLFV